MQGQASIHRRALGEKLDPTLSLQLSWSNRVVDCQQPLEMILQLPRHPHQPRRG